MNTRLIWIAIIVALCGCKAEISAPSYGPNMPNQPPKKENGGVDGGGGKAVVCRDESGAITSAEVLDLYEARVMFGYHVKSSPAPMADQVKTAIGRLPESTRLSVSAFSNLVMDNLQIMPDSSGLLPIDDSLEVVTPKGCAAEQLANYRTEKLILVDGEIWTKLSETDRAALVLHEAVYALNRNMGAIDSRRSRHVVGRLFDDTKAWEKVGGGVPKTALHCMSQQAPLLFWALPESTAGVWNLEFAAVGAGLVYSKTTAMLFAPEMDFEEAKTFPVVKGEDRIGEFVKVGLTTQSLVEGGDSLVITKRWEALKDASGRVIRGYQTPRYYLQWFSGTFPKLNSPEIQLNCSLTF